jgi:predicted ATPase
MIEKLSVKNFKSWADLPELKFGKVTALFGANSSGKTSLIQLLLMLKQTAASQDRRVLNLGGTERDYVDLGSYENIVHSHNLDLDIGLGLTWFRNFYEPSLRWSGGNINLEILLSYIGKTIVVKRLSYAGEIGNVQYDIDDLEPMTL